MFRSCIFHSLKTLALRKCISHRLSICLFHRRLFCSQNADGDDGSSDNLPAEGRYIPQRIKKRLEEKGLCIDDLEYKPAGQVSSDIDLEQALHSMQHSIVDKNIEIDFPSDVEKRKYLRNQEKHAYRPIDFDPEETTILLFPGQGSQFVGMGKQLLAYPGVQNLYHKASEILGYDLLRICIGGPKDMLDKTIYCQPAVVVTSLAAFERLKEEYPKASEKCVGVAGFSVGELTALIASEMISFEDGIQLIKLRAKAMQNAAETVPSGMLTVFCDHQTNLRTAIVAAREYCRTRMDIEEPVCKVANFLCTNIKVVAGHEEALQFLQQYGKEWGIYKTKRLPVSGAFHTNLMYGGRPFWKYWNAWDNVELKQPKYRVYSNLDGKQYQFEDKNEDAKIKHIFKKQIQRPVAWEQLMHILYTRKQGVSFPKTFEVGPGRQLGYLLGKTNSKAYELYKNIEC